MIYRVFIENGRNYWYFVKQFGTKSITDLLAYLLKRQNFKSHAQPAHHVNCLSWLGIEPAIYWYRYRWSIRVVSAFEANLL